METYQGWKNHATWMVALHLSNTDYMNNTAQEIVGANPDDYDAAQKLYDYVEESLLHELPSPSRNNWGWLLTDVVFSVLEDVDFREIVESYREQTNK